MKSGCFDSYVELTSLYDKRLARNRGRIAFSALRKHEESQFVACMDEGVFRPMEVRRCVESASGPEQFVGERGAPPVSGSACLCVYGNMEFSCFTGQALHRFGEAFDSIPNHEMPQFMPNTPERRIAINEHARGEVDPPNRQVGIGKFGPVGMKGGPALQELVVFEDHKRH